MKNNQVSISNDSAPHNHREGYRIIQIHPSLNCNLECRHCYSSSAPGLKKSLDIESLKYFVSSAYDMGYNTIAISGGEPFLYPELRNLLNYTKQIGYYNSITTNGALLTSKRNQEILQYVDLLAISIDGTKEEHNFIRNNPKAFDQLLSCIDIVKPLGTRFGFIHLLHNEPLEVLSWLCEFTLSNGGKLLHLHPFENAGRGKLLQQLQLSDEQAYRFFILYHYYKQKHENDFLMQLDLLHKNIIIDYPELVYTFSDTDLPTEDYMRELIIDENGSVLPISHGFNCRLALGNINDRKSLNSLMSIYRSDKLQILKSLYSETYYEMLNNPKTELFNFAELIIEKSYQMELVIH